MNSKQRTFVVTCILFSLFVLGIGTIYQVYSNTAASATVFQETPKIKSEPITSSTVIESPTNIDTVSTKSLYYIYITSKWKRMKGNESAPYLASGSVAQNTSGSIINEYSASQFGTTKVVTPLKTGPSASYSNVVQLPAGKAIELLGEITNPAGDKWLMYEYAYATFFVAASDVEIIVQTPTPPPSLTAVKAPTKPASQTTPSTPTTPTTPNATPNAQKIVSLAFSKLGSAYVYGAEGPNSFDCSGFVYWVVNNSGIPGLSVPRTSSALYTQFQAYNIGTSIADAHPGDIILFSNNGTIVHSAIYYNDSKMIHASTSTTGVILTTVAYSLSNKSIFAIIRLPGC